MAVEDIATAHYRDQQRLARLIAEQAQRLWGTVEPGRVLDSWLAVLQEILLILMGGQRAAAAMAQPYLDAVAVEQALPPATSVVNPAMFAGLASDGRALASLLMQPALRTLGLMRQGVDEKTALRSGLASLTRIVDTQIADASRAADQVAITARREWVMYVRVVNLPACGRCIILAGRVYSWSTGFARHDLCDCSMRPFREGEEPPPSPRELIEQMSLPEQAKAFTIAGAEAIRLGADPGQVVNARRGMKTAADGRRVTTEGTTRRGIAGRRRRGAVRLMPEQILADSGGNRERALELLEENGYLLRRPQAPARQADQVTLRVQSPDMSPEEASTLQEQMLQERPWTAEEREALIEYTGGWSSSINKLLRYSEKRLKRDRVSTSGIELAERFTAAMDSAMRPLPRAVTLYRYVAPDAFGVRTPGGVKRRVGTTMQERGFMSTTLARVGHTDGGQMARASERPVLMEIDVPAGTPAAYVDGLSAYQGQWEMILAAGVTFRVVAVETAGAHTVVRVRVEP